MYMHLVSRPDIDSVSHAYRDPWKVFLCFREYEAGSGREWDVYAPGEPSGYRRFAHAYGDPWRVDLCFFVSVNTRWVCEV